MTIRTSKDILSNNTRHNKEGVSIYHTAPKQYKRNPSWLTLPSVSSSEQKIVFLAAIYPNSHNCFAFVARANAGVSTITTDWGDGTSSFNQNDSVAGKFEKVYDYNNSALDGTNKPCTFSAATDLITSNNHGYLDGDIVNFYYMSTSVGLMEDRDYVVVNATTNTFQVKLTQADTSIVNITTDGTGTLLEYKQAIITVTGTGIAISRFSMQQKHPNLGKASASGTKVAYNFLEAIVSLPSCSSWTMGNSSLGGTYSFPVLERFSILSMSSSNDAASLFANSFPALVEVPTLYLAPLNSTIQNFFLNCYALQKVPNLTHSGITTALSAFEGCESLVYAPELNLPSCNVYTSCFSKCYALVKAPTIKFSTSVGIGLNLSSMFANCYRLSEIPDYDTSEAVNFSSMFTGCRSLKKAPPFNTSNGTSFATMFQTCDLLEEVPEYNLTNATSTASMFIGCNALRYCGSSLIKIPKCTNASSMFQNCTLLTELPDLEIGGASPNFTNMFNNCPVADGVVKIKVSSSNPPTGTGQFSNTFQNCNLLEDVVLDFGNSTATWTFSATFQDCWTLLSVIIKRSTADILGTSGSIANMFQNCYSLRYHSTIYASSATAVTQNTTPYTNTGNLRDGYISGLRIAGNWTMPQFLWNASKVKEFTDSFAGYSSITTPSITFQTTPQNYKVAKTGITATNGSTTVTMTSTSGLTVGMHCAAQTGWDSSISAKSPSVTANVFTFTGHGLPEGCKIAFKTSAPSGCSIDTIYTVNVVDANNFKLLLNGVEVASPVTAGTLYTMIYACFIKTIDSGTQITLTSPYRGTAGSSLTRAFRTSDMSSAGCKGYLFP